MKLVTLSAALALTLTACSSGDDKGANHEKTPAEYAKQKAQLDLEYEKAFEAGDNGLKSKLMPELNTLEAEINRLGTDTAWMNKYEQAYTLEYDRLITTI